MSWPLVLKISSKRPKLIELRLKTKASKSKEVRPKERTIGKNRKCTLQLVITRKKTSATIRNSAKLITFCRVVTWRTSSARNALRTTTWTRSSLKPLLSSIVKRTIWRTSLTTAKPVPRLPVSPTRKRLPGT
uniref:(northern house mosquito) hypothetical protein n=1 Tax=Culex pipiens TaxID=7175 RepID=A0A8D8IMN4_CULPI